MPEQLIAVFDGLLELYELRCDAQRRGDGPALDSVETQIQELERAVSHLRRRGATIH